MGSNASSRNLQSQIEISHACFAYKVAGRRERERVTEKESMIMELIGAVGNRLTAIAVLVFCAVLVLSRLIKE